MPIFFSNNLATLADPTTRSAQTLNVGEAHGRVRNKRIEIELPDTANADEVRLATFRSNDRIVGMQIAYDDLGTAGTLNVGIAYSGDNNDGATIDADCFASLLDLSSAAVGRTEISGESGVNGGASLFGKTLWQVGAIATDPGGYIDLLGVTPTGTTTAGTVVLMVQYVAGD
tara:strand:+ start:392 stop:907 length:516 start_codon:yes stop_codon:yes gene_type:complete